MRSYSLFLFALFLSPAAQAATSFSSNGFKITLEPILGYEFFQRSTPTPHRAGMLIYGARFTAGQPHLSLEGEYTRGNDTEVFTSPSGVTVNTQKENVRLGGRATHELGQALDAFIRFGGQASKIKTDTLSGSSTTTTNGSWEIHPYLGSGVQIHPAAFFSLGFQADYVFYSISDFTQNSIQVSTSVRLHFNTR